MGVAVANYSLFTITITSFYSLLEGTEVTTNMLHDVGQLPLVTARIAHQIGHYARRFIPTEVGIMKFCIADVCAKYGEKLRN